MLVFCSYKNEYIWTDYALNTNLDLGTQSTLLNYTYLGRN